MGILFLKKTKKMTTILDIELPSQQEDDLEAESQDAENPICDEDADQIPVGTVSFPLSKTVKGDRTGEAFVFDGDDQKVTNINELDCNDTLDEDDHVLANEEDVEKQEENDSEDIDEDNDEDLNNIEKVETLKCCQHVEDENDKLVKMKFKDVEELKRMKKDLESKEDASMEDNENSTPIEKESTASTCQTENCLKEGHNVEYKEEEDADYNPIYDDTLSDVEEPEDMDNEEDVDLKKPVEVVYTNDQFCMIKEDNMMKIGADSREEMECC